MSFLFCLGIVGCASVSVKEQKVLTTKQPYQIPKKIFIIPFEFDDSKVRVDRSGPSLESFKNTLNANLIKQLTKRLDERLVPAKEVPNDTVLPAGNYWLITGKFTRIAQGSRLLRILIGCGAGGTKLDCVVTVSDMFKGYPTPFLRIRTTGGSNISPGAITGLNNPWGVGLNAISGLPTGLTYDTTRTAREINAALLSYLSQHGALPESQVIYPKELGKFPYLSLQQYIPNKPVKKSGTVIVTPAPQR